MGKIGTVADTLGRTDSQWMLRKAIEKDVVLDGSFAWLVNLKSANYRQLICASSSFVNLLLNSVNLIGVHHNGRMLRSKIGATNTDEVYVGMSNLSITVTNDDSGWSDALEPTSNDAKRYINGWKYTNGTTWTSVTGNGQTATAQVALDTKPTDYTPYKVSYILATPQVINVHNKVEGALKLNGLTQVEVLSGVVRREKVVPKLDANYYTVPNSTSSYWGTAKLKYKVNRYIRIYKNGFLDESWTITSDGTMAMRTIPSTFDPKAEYTVTYIALDKHLLTTNPTNVKLTYGANFASVVSDLVTYVEDLMRDVNINKFIQDYIEAKVDNNRIDLDAHTKNADIHVTKADKAKWDAGGRGEKGEKGDPGIQSTKGADGVTGAKGEQGIQGPTGLQGPKGEATEKVQ
ncbi:collagen-like triple helix repeat-containing protein [Psychrobacillus glaciei]|nr:collagen-like protein [Psychrobacillus glaciei]